MPAVTTHSSTTTTATATATSTTAKSSSKRFELPALNFKFSSLTEGTDIPAPLPSPTEEVPPTLQVTAPKTNAANGVPKSSQNIGTTTTVLGGLAATSPDQFARTGIKRTADEVPPSPTLSTRPGSIRRLFSRNLMNAAYADGEESAASADASANTLRPDSRSDSIADERKARRSSGWFRRLRGTEGYAASTAGAPPSSPLSKRSSVVFDGAGKPAEKPAGPPPPMIPELGELQAKVGLDDGSSLGNDLFKNIE